MSWKARTVPCCLGFAEGRRRRCLAGEAGAVPCSRGPNVALATAALHTDVASWAEGDGCQMVMPQTRTEEGKKAWQVGFTWPGPILPGIVTWPWLLPRSPEVCVNRRERAQKKPKSWELFASYLCLFPAVPQPRRVPFEAIQEHVSATPSQPQTCKCPSGSHSLPGSSRFLG